MSVSNSATSTCGAFSAYTLDGPPDRITAAGDFATISAALIVDGTISEYTLASRTRRAISCAYWAPKSTTRTGCASRSGVPAGDAPAGGVAASDTAAGGVPAEGVAAEGIAAEGIAAEGIAAEGIAAGDTAECDVSVGTPCRLSIIENRSSLSRTAAHSLLWTDHQPSDGGSGDGADRPAALARARQGVVSPGQRRVLRRVACLRRRAEHPVPRIRPRSLRRARGTLPSIGRRRRGTGRLARTVAAHRQSWIAPAQARSPNTIRAGSLTASDPKACVTHRGGDQTAACPLR